MIIPLNDKGRIVEEVVNDLRITPSTILIEQRQRRIPMKQHRSNLEVLLDELSNDIVVVLHALFVDRTLTKGKDARPGNGEAERRHAQVLEPSKVLLVEVVVRRCDVRGGVVGYLVYDAVAEKVPDRWAFSFGVYSALVVVSDALLASDKSTYLDLKGRGSNTPREAFRQRCNAQVRIIAWNVRVEAT